MRSIYFLILSVFLLGSTAVLRSPARAATGEIGSPAQVVASGYNDDKQTAPYVGRTGLASADTVTSDAAVIALHTPVWLRGRPTLDVSARFNQASKTCDVTVFLLSQKPDKTYYIKGRWDALTITGPATKFGDSYMAASKAFDSLGASHAIVAVTTAPTGGATVDLGIGTE